MNKIQNWKVLYLRYLLKRKKMFDVFSVFYAFDVWWKRNAVKFFFWVWFE